MISLAPDQLGSVVVLGAHCDDIAIGAGGTLLAACAASPGLRVTALVLSGAGSKREEEERAALAAFCPGAHLDVEVLDLPDGRMPAHWDRVKEALESLARKVSPDVVIGPAKHDAHQDHRTLAQLLTTAFRDQLVLGYEIIKWDSDQGQPVAFVPLAASVALRKAELLDAHYPSQRGRDWFDAETFLGLARMRGVQCRARYAEAFFVDKVVLGLGEG
ncbi:PIG-L deacetylase family protein [Allokutzneria albata]|uniref:N-acetylglucosaminyl deacetylase, LmbE family n=1 Tax=Allokutzneria albata TaxID=211114 RepID=A0A1H0CF09_ALLAB|nr:PIG-L family deacetylase [Allokutzneria albata]SDN56467.1 N-acetylglucosaminyl deacetylase, LmbE family [Allokutzneria albata]